MSQVFIYEEPHESGGWTRVTMSREQLIRWMRRREPDRHKSFSLTDEALISEFKIAFWGWETTEGNLSNK